jgi:hypothetical protein
VAVSSRAVSMTDSVARDLDVSWNARGWPLARERGTGAAGALATARAHDGALQRCGNAIPRRSVVRESSLSELPSTGHVGVDRKTVLAAPPVRRPDTRGRPADEVHLVSSPIVKQCARSHHDVTTSGFWRADRAAPVPADGTAPPPRHVSARAPPQDPHRSGTNTLYFRTRDRSPALRRRCEESKVCTRRW